MARDCPKAELILDPLVEGIPSIFNDILADKKVKPKDQIAELFNKKDISNRLLNYFESVQVKIPYEEGMDPYSGLLEMFESKGIVEKVGNKLSYVSPITGEEIKEFRKGWTGDKLQVIINEFGQNPNADVNADYENASDIDSTDEMEEV